MNLEEAQTVLRTELERYRNNSRGELQRLLSEPDVKEVHGASGTIYQVEIEAVWDDRVGGDLRILGHIDDGGIRAFAPLTRDFIVAPDGSTLDFS